MALRFNGNSPVGATPYSAMPLRTVGNTAASYASSANILSLAQKGGGRFNRRLSLGPLASDPPCAEVPVTWSMAEIGGDLSADNSVNSSSSIEFNLQRGINASCDIGANGDITSASLSMITALAADLAADCGLSISMQMALSIAANIAASGDIDSSLGLIAWCLASIEQSCSVSDSNLNGTARLEANIVSYSEFTAEGVRDAVWNAILSNYNATGSAGKALSTAGSGGVDYNLLAGAVWQYVIESGISAEQAMRIYGAVLGGKVSGAGTGTETFTGLDGTTVRVTSTVDASGNRTSVVVNGA